MSILKTLGCLGLAATIMGTAAMAQVAPKPTAEHKVLAEEEGTWDATIKSFDGGPDAEPTVSKGTEVNTILPGGLWLVSRFEGEFAGLKFEGRGQFGYDPVKKKYVGSWIDSMNPTLSILEGTYDAKTKTLTYVGDGVEPNSGTKFTQKMVTTIKADGSRVFTLYMKFDPAGDDVKFMEANYIKRK